MSEYCTNCKTLADLNINQAKTIKEVRELLRQKDIETERLARENAMLHERTKPNTVVLIGNTGHYVNDAVAQHIDQLRQKDIETERLALEKECLRKDYDAVHDRCEKLQQRIDELEAMQDKFAFAVNHMPLDDRTYDYLIEALTPLEGE